ncbi:uncharacterized protein LOC141664489 [Apium graveolens]|uniref:uncharacterized protein LOC141664487 n=1 Tax=Apium graveolens TaxID=4045 RepID=UPI003D7AA938
MANKSLLNKKMSKLTLAESDDDLLYNDGKKLTKADFVDKGIEDEYILTDEVWHLSFEQAREKLDYVVELLENNSSFLLPNLEPDNTVFSSSTGRIVRKVSKRNRGGMRKLQKTSRDFLECLVRRLIMNLDSLMDQKSNVHMYLRALYYGMHNEFPELNVTTGMVDDYIDALCCLFKCDRESLGVTACDIDSSYVGNIIVHRQDVSGVNRKVVKENATKLTSPYRVNFGNIKSIQPSEVPPRCILIVEKLTVFRALCSSDIHRKIPCVIISGSGQPSIDCRLFVKRVHECFPDVPIFAIVDCNPFGFDIFKTYKYGSMKLAFMSRNLAVASIRLIGLFYSEISGFGVKDDQLQSLTKHDSNRLKNMIGEEWLKHEEEVSVSLKRIMETQRKADVEIVANWVDKIQEKIISLLDSNP